MVKTNLQDLKGLLCFIFILSLVTIVPTLIDKIYSIIAYSKYEVIPLFTVSNPYEYRNYKIEFISNPTPKLKINDRSFDLPYMRLENKSSFQEKYTDFIRYLEVKDKKNKKSQLAILIKKKHEMGIFSSFRKNYRIILISDKGIETEDFSLFERRHPIYRPMLLKYVSGQPIGWVNNITNSYPTIITPYFFPISTLILSFLFMLVINRKL